MASIIYKVATVRVPAEAVVSLTDVGCGEMPDCCDFDVGGDSWIVCDGTLMDDCSSSWQTDEFPTPVDMFTDPYIIGQYATVRFPPGSELIDTRCVQSILDDEDPDCECEEA